MTEKPRKIIAVVNRKGGVSKTTSSGYFAECLLMAGKSVTGIDTDPEKGWVKWHGSAKLQYPVIAATAETLGSVVKGIDGYIVIDTPPNDGEIILSAGLLADEIVVPVAATGHDMSRLQSTLALVERVEQGRGKALASVILTRWKPGIRLGREVVEEMEKRNIPVAQTKIRNLTRYETFTLPTYLDEYQSVLKELGIL